ncbi:MAG: hypothetical protein AAFY56_03155 [Pseudomonadota bacterium]
MDFQELFASTKNDQAVTRATLIGVGQFGRTLLAQSGRMPTLELSVLCDLDLERMIKACKAAGLSDDDYCVVDSKDQAMRAFEIGKTVLSQDSDIAISVPVDIVVEATGNPEAGAINAMSALDQGRHLAMVTKETDSIIGPLLSHRARQASLILTQVDGDQPSLLLGLMSWARTLGLDVVSGGKASEYDFVFDPETSIVKAEGLEVSVQVDPSLWLAAGDDMTALIRHRRETLAAIPQRTPPDFCEMCLVANGSGLRPDQPAMHAAIAKPRELPDIYCPKGDGGVLERRGTLDIFNCFRRTDEISFAGGVFAVLEVPDEETGRLFKKKGIPVSRNEKYVLVYNPTHLLGVEAPFSLLVAHKLGLSTGSNLVEPVCDMGMLATEDLAAGTTLTDQGYHHRIIGVDPVLLDHAKLTGDAPLPYFMGINRELTRNIKQGELITRNAVIAPTGSRLWNLRDEQDRLL